MEPNAKPTVARLSESEKIVFGPDAHYNKLIGEAGMPIFTGIQTSQPGYATPVHSHPYVEMLFIIEGTCEAWLDGHEDEAMRLEAGDMCALPARKPHAFRVVGDKPMRLLGIHCSPKREVHFADGSATGENGYQVLDEQLRPLKG
jgi:mannose-6-phosphate isomerase-like protein (cupin superfamily)